MGHLARNARLAVHHCHCGHRHATLVTSRFFPVLMQTVDSLEKRGLIKMVSFHGRHQVFLLNNESTQRSNIHSGLNYGRGVTIENTQLIQ